MEEALAAQQSFEAEDVSFEAELQSMAAFSKLPEDEGRVSQYALPRPSQRLRRELDEYVTDRTATFNAVRAGGAVVSGTAENDVQAVLSATQPAACRPDGMGHPQRTPRAPAAVAEECRALQARYGVQPGSTWGTLPSRLQTHWARLACDPRVKSD